MNNKPVKRLTLLMVVVTHSTLAWTSQNQTNSMLDAIGTIFPLLSLQLMCFWIEKLARPSEAAHTELLTLVFKISSSQKYRLPENCCEAAMRWRA